MQAIVLIVVWIQPGKNLKKNGGTKKNVDIKDLILLKAGQTTAIKIPIHLKVKLSNNCYWEIRDYNKQKDLKITYYYRKKKSELASKFLSPQLLEKLEMLHYKLYDKEIESNKVKLIL